MENTQSTPSRKAYFDRILKKLEFAGIYMPNRNIVTFLENIQKKIPAKELELIPEKSTLYTSVSEYLVTFEKRTTCNPINITDEAIMEMEKAINYLSKNKALLKKEELAIVMLSQLIRIHCVCLSSKIFTDSGKNFSVIIASDIFWKGIGAKNAHKHREFKFIPRVYD